MGQIFFPKSNISLKMWFHFLFQWFMSHRESGSCYYWNFPHTMLDTCSFFHKYANITLVAKLLACKSMNSVLATKPDITATLFQGRNVGFRHHRTAHQQAIGDWDIFGVYSAQTWLVILQCMVQPGSKILYDSWAVYNNIQLLLGFQHAQVNCSDPSFCCMSPLRVCT